MKIVLFIEALQVGGAETLLVRNALAFKQRGEEVVVVVNRLVGSFLERQLADNGIEVIPLVGPKRHVRGYRLLRKASGLRTDRTKAWEKMLEEVRPDIVHLHSAPNVLLEELLFSPRRFAFTFHTAAARVLEMLNGRQRRSLEYLARNEGMIVSISSTVENGVMELLHPREIRLVPNCFDVSEVSRTAHDRADFLKMHGLPQDSFVLVHVGRFHPVKNHEKLFRILEKMLEKQPMTYLVLVGSGSAERRAELEHMVDEMGLRDHVIFYGLSDNPAQVMGICDAVALPSLVEGFSLVALEAQALGKRCVVASSVPPEVKCRPNLLFLDVEQPSSVWADHLLGDFVEPDRCTDINEFDEATVIPKILSMYDEMRSRAGIG